MLQGERQDGSLGRRETILVEKEGLMGSHLFMGRVTMWISEVMHASNEPNA